jgi:cysteine desulfurase / selenocysteine lyase
LHLSVIDSSHKSFDGLAQDDLIDRVRADFPILSTTVNNHPLVYLDNAASSQKPIQVIERISRYYNTEHSNVHRGVHHLSQHATDEYEGARRILRDFIGARSTAEIIFTRGTTDAINLVANSFARSTLKPGDEILITHLEHHSNIVPWQMVCEATGAILKVVDISDDGSIDYGHFERSLSDRTRILALAHISNSLGTINPVKRIIADAHGLGIPVLLDGAQAIPHLQVNVAELDVDFYCFSGHKMFGPTGIGVLYGKEQLLEDMPPYQGGGDMIDSVSFSGTTFKGLPAKFEAGTPNIAGAIGLGAAATYIQEIGFEFISDYENQLLERATERLSAIDGVRLIGTSEYKASVVSFLFRDAHPYDVATLLDQFGIAVRSGHHCTQPVMTRFGIPGTVRASFSFYNTLDEIDVLAESLERSGNILFS